MAASKNKSFLIFFLAILLISFFMFFKEWQKRRIPSLVVADNKGIAELFSVEGNIAAVYQDGRVCIWDWDIPEIRKADFAAASGRAIPLTEGRIAAIARTPDRRLLSIYDPIAGKKVKDMTVGWDDQDIYIRNSPDRAQPTLMRRNPERGGAIEVEFAAVNTGAELLYPPVSVLLEAHSQTLRDYAVSNGGIVAAAGADGDKARLIAVDLNSGRTLWEQRWDEGGELTSAAFALDGTVVWAGDKRGNLLKISAEDGRLLERFSLLRPGETRTVTNDLSVLNIVVSPDGLRLGCTITPIAYAVDAQTGLVTHRLGGHKVVSKVAFSPDSRRLATADLRADGVVRIHTLDDKK